MQAAFQTLQDRLKTILPEEYQDSYEDLEPVSMGSAKLKYGSDGRVAWGDIWGSFCNLAMAGGPPHKGMLLEPGSEGEIRQHPDRYCSVVDEITRGIRLSSDVAVIESKRPGWVRVDCGDPTMAGWLLRAIVMENISCRWEGTTIDLPAGAKYRVEKEIKNVVTSVAKTTHYWTGHMGRAQRAEIRKTFAEMESESPLVQPAFSGVDCSAEANISLAKEMAEEVRVLTGLGVSSRRYGGWLGFDCGGVRPAVWMMRLLVSTNVLARRERSEVFVPVNPAVDPEGRRVVRALEAVHGFARMESVI